MPDPALVQSVNHGVTTAPFTNSRTLTWSTQPQQGNLLVVSVRAMSNTSGDDLETLSSLSGTGWTRLLAPPRTDKTDFFAVYYKIAGNSEPMSVTWSMPNTGRIAMVMEEFSGIDQTNPVDVADTYPGDVAGDGAVATATSSILRPNYMGGLYHVSCLGLTNSTAFDITAAPTVHPSYPVSSTGFSSHGATNTDGVRRYVRCFYWVGSSTEDGAGCFTVSVSSSAQRFNAFLVIFRRANAQAARSLAAVAASPAITLAQSKIFGGGAQGSAVTVTLNSAPVQGQLLVVCIGAIGDTDPSTTIVPNDGHPWTLLAHDVYLPPATTTYNRHAVFARYAGSGETASIGLFQLSNNASAYWVYLATAWNNAVLQPSGAMTHTHNPANYALISTGNSIDNTHGSRELILQALPQSQVLAIWSCFAGTTHNNAYSLQYGWSSLGNGGGFAKIHGAYAILDNTGGPYVLTATEHMVMAAGTEGGFLSHLVIIGPLATGADHWAWAEESADSWAVAV
jgi:hypothetical protein